MEKIIVSHHAINKYKERTLSWDMSNGQAQKQLSLIAQRGSITRRCPGDVMEITYNGDAIIAKIDEESIRVITYLGNKRYRHWFKKKELRPRFAARAI